MERDHYVVVDLGSRVKPSRVSSSDERAFHSISDTDRENHDRYDVVIAY